MVPKIPSLRAPRLLLLALATGVLIAGLGLLIAILGVFGDGFVYILYFLLSMLGLGALAFWYAAVLRQIHAERSQAEQELATSQERLRILHQIDRALIEQEEPEAIAAAILPLLRDLLKVRRTIVNLFDLAKGEVEWLAAAGRRRVHVGPGVRYSMQFMGDVEALHSGKLQFIDTHTMPPGPEVDALLASGVDKYVVVPMIAVGELIGALSFGGAAEQFSGEQLSIAQEAATQFAIILHQKRMAEKQRLLEDQYRQSQKMEAIGKLAGGVAHDFNNLLTVINGYADLVQERLPREDPNRELLREITKAGEKAALLTRQLLTFSRRQIVMPRVLDLGEILADAEKMLHRVIEEDIRLSVASEPKLPLMMADAGQLDQVLLNLAVNARDAMPKGGTLTITAARVLLDEEFVSSHPESRTGSHVLLTVSDTGIGMDAATKARIFEPFFTTKKDKGTGLGLATVYAIVKQNDGYIEVESELGRGTTFKLYFPATQHERLASRSNPSLQVIPLGNETLLLVEDEDGIRALSRHILEGCGYHVLEAGDGVKALQVAKAFRDTIHLVATDVVMPGMSGREMADRLVPLHPESKILFLSGYTDDIVLRHGVLKAETSFLPKPFTPEALARKVREVLDSGKPKSNADESESRE